MIKIKNEYKGQKEMIDKLFSIVLKTRNQSSEAEVHHLKELQQWSSELSSIDSQINNIRSKHRVEKASGTPFRCSNLNQSMVPTTSMLDRSGFMDHPHHGQDEPSTPRQALNFNADDNSQTFQSPSVVGSGIGRSFMRGGLSIGNGNNTTVSQSGSNVFFMNSAMKSGRKYLKK
jgi:hypothetical protein